MLINMDLRKKKPRIEDKSQSRTIKVREVSLRNYADHKTKCVVAHSPGNANKSSKKSTLNVPPLCESHKHRIFPLTDS